MERQIFIPDMELIAKPNGTVEIAKRHKIVYNGWTIDIDPKPVPFISDGSSIPPMFYGLVCPKKTLIPGIIHDWLYDTGEVWVDSRKYRITRQQADMVWADVVVHCVASTAIATLGYIGLRIGGWKAWNYYRKTDRVRKMHRLQKAESSAERILQ
ncbi:MAG: DUF1353 domain-containing protein [Phycisphaerae bacterium]|nr:DUF1353 domain-containing protein [Phycisphaerae bacterium]